MKSKLMRMLITLTLIVATVGFTITQVEASIVTPIQTTYAGTNSYWVIDYWWEIDTVTNYSKLYSDVYLKDNVNMPAIYPPIEGNAFWYNSGNFYDVTVPSNWYKDYSYGVGGQTETIGAGIGKRLDNADKSFIHYSSGYFNSQTIDGGILLTNRSLNSFSINVPSQLVNTTVVPEPISSILFVTGGALLAGRRFMRRKA